MQGDISIDVAEEIYQVRQVVECQTVLKHDQKYTTMPSSSDTVLKKMPDRHRNSQRRYCIPGHV